MKLCEICKHNKENPSTGLRKCGACSIVGNKLDLDIDKLKELLGVTNER